MVEKNAPVIIAGCGRSGTTYLKTLIDAHPDVFIPTESLFIVDYLLFSQYIPKQLLSFLFFREPQLRSWYRGPSFRIDDIVGALYRTHLYAARENGKNRWGQKTPRFVRHMHLFDQTFSGLKWILIHRDPRAVVTSMLKSKQHTYSVFFACKRWIRDNSPIIRILNSDHFPDKVLIMSYEETICDLSAAMNKVYHFLGIDPIAMSEIFRRYKITPLNGSKFPINTIRDGIRPQKANINAWRDFLSIEKIKYIEAVCSYEMQALGYTPLFHLNKKLGKITMLKMHVRQFISTFKNILIAFEYLQKWPQYLIHTGLRKSIMLVCFLTHKTRRLI